MTSTGPTRPFWAVLLQVKAWAYGGNGTWSIVDGRAGLTAISSGSSANAWVDANASNGILSGTVAEVGTQKSTGLTFRVIDNLNAYYINRTSSSVLKWSLFKMVAGTATSLGPSTVDITAGQAMSVELSGANVVAKANGATIITASDSELLAGTRHGLIGTTAEHGAPWDNVNFVAA